MAYLFDTDAISELLRPRPLPIYVDWIGAVPREEQFTSAVVVGELYKGAYRSQARQLHLANIERRILPAITVLPYDAATAKEFGAVSLFRSVAPGYPRERCVNGASDGLHGFTGK